MSSASESRSDAKDGGDVRAVSAVWPGRGNTSPYRFENDLHENNPQSRIRGTTDNSTNNTCPLHGDGDCPPQMQAVL